MKTFDYPFHMIGFDDKHKILGTIQNSNLIAFEDNNFFLKDKKGTYANLFSDILNIPKDYKLLKSTLKY